MFLIVGLGNPGQQYSGTRHNAGFMVLDFLAEKNNLTYADSKWKASFVKGVAWNEPVVLLKPATYMNLSGMAVVQAAHFYKLQAADILVIHDDLDMDLGRIKMVAGGGDGGHKGIRSIIEQLGTKDFSRLKIGIGRPTIPMAPEKYVLERFEPVEREVIGKKMEHVLEGIRIFLQQGVQAAMTFINRKESQDIS
jgi:PTH1 family peptidyl-tRNA hydrolase